MFLNILLTKYGWLITNVPKILHIDPLWKFWLDNLSEHTIFNMKMNVSGIKNSRDFVIDEFDNYDPVSDEFECLSGADLGKNLTVADFV